MPKQLNVALNFTANTTQAKQSVTELSNLLTKIAYGTNINVSATGINEASTAAKELAFHLNKAYDATTGNFDLSKLNTSLKQAGTNITQLSTKLLTAGETGQQAFVKLAQSISQANAPIMKTNGLLTQMWTTMQNTLRWQISSSILHGFMGAIQKASSYAKDLNKSLNNIRIVTGNSTEQMAKFAEQANKAARALNTTTTTYTDAALIYYQQGLSDKEVQARTDVTVKMANVAGESADTIASEMTAVWNNFNKAGDYAEEHFADVMTKLGAETASSTKEIATGLEKFAAIADTVGLSFDYAAAALATVTATTRESADVVGTAFKTIFGRLEGLKLGETLDDGTDLNKYSQALLSVGVNIKDTSGELKDMDTILDELGERWKTLSKDQQVALAETVGGMRQYNQMMALMGNWDFFQENLDRTQNSDGTLQKQADIYAESWEAARKKVKASMESLYSDLIDDKFFINLNNGFAQAIDGIDKFIDHLGGIKPLLISIGSLILSSVSNKITPALQQAVQNLTIMAGGARRVYNQISQEMSKNIESQIASNNYNLVDQQSLRNAQQLIEAKTRLSMASKHLTEAERAENEMFIEGLQLQQARVMEYAQDAQAKASSVDAIYEEIHQYDLLGIQTEGYKNQLKDLISIRETWFETASRGDATDADFLEFRKASDAVNEYKKTMVTLPEAIQNSLNALTGIIDGTHTFGNDTQRAQAVTKSFREDLTDLANDVAANGSNFADMQHAVLAYADSLPETIKLMNGFSEAFDQIRLTSDPDILVENVEKLVDIINTFKLSAKDAAKIADEFNPKARWGSKLEAGLKAETEAMQKLKTEAALTRNSLNNFVPKHTVTGLEALTKSVSTLGNVAMSINMISSAFKTLNDENATGIEKFTAFAMAASMTVPSISAVISSLKALTSTELAQKAGIEVLNLFHSKRITTLAAEAQQLATNAVAEMGLTGAEADAVALKSAKASIETLLHKANLVNLGDKAKEIAATALLKGELTEENLQKTSGLTLAELSALGLDAETIAKLAEAGATQVATSANVAFMASLGPVLLALGALVGIIALVVAAVKKAKAESPEAQLAAISERLDALNTSAQDASDALEKLTTSYNDYENVIDGLKKCEKATNDWYDALVKANNLKRQINEENADTIAAYEAANPGKSAWIKDEHGYDILSPEYLEFAKKSTAAANLAADLGANQAAYDKTQVTTSTVGGETYEEKINTFWGLNAFSKGETQKGLSGSGQSGKFWHSDVVQNGIRDYLADTTPGKATANEFAADLVANNLDELLLGQFADQAAMQAEYDKYTTGVFAKQGAKTFTDKYGLIRQDDGTFVVDQNARDFYQAEINNRIGAMETTEWSYGWQQAATNSINQDNEMFDAGESLRAGNIEDIVNRAIGQYGEETGFTYEDRGYLSDDFKNQLYDSYASIYNDYLGESTQQIWSEAKNLPGYINKEFKRISGDTVEFEDGTTIDKTQFAQELASSKLVFDDNFGKLITDGFTAALTEKASHPQTTTTTIDTASLLSQGEIAKALKNVEKNGFLSDKDYQAAIEEGGLSTDFMEQYFQTMSDGTHKLVVDAGTLRQAIDDIDITNLEQNIKSNENTKNKIDNEMDGVGYWSSPQRRNAFVNNLSNGLTESVWNNKDSSLTQTAESLISATGLEYDENATIEEKNALLQQAISIYQTLTGEIENNKSALASYADTMGELDAMQLGQDTEIYGQNLERLASNYSSCSDELSEYQRAVKSYGRDSKQATTASKNLAKSIKDAEWHKAAKGVKECLTNLDKLTDEAEKDEAFETLAKNFNTAFDTKVTSKWVKDNIDLIKQWSQATGTEAQEIALQLSALAQIEETALDAKLTVDDADGYQRLANFNEAYDILNNAISNNPIKVTGESEVDLTALITALQEAGADAKWVADYLASIGETDIEFGGDMSGLGSMDLSTEAGIQAFLDAWGKLKGKFSVKGGYVPKESDVDMKKIGGSSGGGGSNKQKKKEVERYHEDVAKLDDLTKAYERASRAKDKLYGARRLAAIDDEIKATDALIKQQKTYIGHIEEFAADNKDLAAMQSAIATYLPGMSADIKENGLVDNWTTIMDAAAAKYAGDTSDTADEDWEEFEKAIKQYEETFNKLEEERAKLEEYELQRQELVLEKINEKLQINISIDENDLKMIEITAERMADNFAKYGEMIAIMAGTYDVYNSEYKTYENHIIELGQKLKDNEINSAQYVEAMQGAYDNLLDAAKDLMAYDEKMLDYYGQALDDASAKLDPYLNQLEHINSVFEHYSDILDLTSKKDADYYKKKDTLLKGVVTNTNNEYKAAKDYYDMIVDQKNEAEKLWATVKNDPNAPNYDAIKKQWDAICAAEQEAHERMLEDAQAWADSVQAVYDNLVESILAKWEEDVTGGLGFDTISDRFDNLATYQEEWLTKTNQIYEMNKLLRKVTADMDKTNNVAAKQRLANFSKELEAKREQKELSQFELKIEQAKYEQLLAQIALEEAQNAKSKVMLSQDSEGNFGYVYTADQNAIDEAEQAAEDANNNLYNIYLDGARDYGNKINKENQRYNQEKADIMERFAKDEEKQREELLRAAEQHQAILQSYYGNYEMAMEGLGDKMFEAFTSDYDSIIRKSAEAGLDITTDIGDLIDAGHDYQDAMDDIADEVVGDYKDVETETQQLKNDSNALYKEVKDNLIPTLKTGLTGALSKVSEYISTQRTEVQELIDKYIELGSKAKTALELEANKAPEENKTEPPKTDTISTETPKASALAVGSTVSVSSSTHILSTSGADMGLQYFRNDPIYVITGINGNLASVRHHSLSSGITGAFYLDDLTAMKTGGYTGEWGPEGKLALLHQKELVLNADDTENILKSVDIIHKIASALDLNMLWNKSSMAHLSASGVGDNNRTLEQTVTITAQFPNARDRSEIEAAFGNLLNRASQYANR